MKDSFAAAGSGAGDTNPPRGGRPQPRLRRPVILLGPPGAGKGTQAKLLAARYGVPHFSTGDMFREDAGRGSELGRRVKAFMDRGELVPDDVVVAMVEERISSLVFAAGFILDGFPRTVAQAEALARILPPTGLDAPIVVHLRVDPSQILRRLTGRRMCRVGGEIYNIYECPPKVPGRCDVDGGELVQRDDDREEVIRGRLAAYEEHTKPVIEYYRRRGLVEELDGSGTPEAVATDLSRMIDRKANRAGHL